MPLLGAYNSKPNKYVSLRNSLFNNKYELFILVTGDDINLGI